MLVNILRTVPNIFSLGRCVAQQSNTNAVCYAQQCKKQYIAYISGAQTIVWTQLKLKWMDYGGEKQ